ncbi:DEAD/DEAH box helicase [uncultured Enterovirga sp.]|uniref:DEAD/DEAH box helicase n=1 Tax=uncultured Enterovirga sp. TaxID=2026352 RepID=UPI0035CAEDC0
MDRLVCGDVVFGKTEVASRAAAAVVLGGRQVAVAAPPTVLVRQHLETFRRRFADLGIDVAHLSRLVSPAEAREVRGGSRLEVSPPPRRWGDPGPAPVRRRRGGSRCPCAPSLRSPCGQAGPHGLRTRRPAEDSPARKD